MSEENIRFPDATDQEIAEAAAAAMMRDDLATQTVGITVAKIGPGISQLNLTVRRDMLNGHMTGHGGYTFMLADTALAFACNSHNQRAMAQHTSLSFLAPTYEGDVLTADAKEVVIAGRSGTYDVVVTNQKGEKVALFRGVSRTIRGRLDEDYPVSHDF